jgi:hypothetical protein
MKRSAWAVILAALAFGCVKSVPPPDASLGSAVDMVRSAWNVGAQNDKVADEHLRRANAEIERAITLMHEGNNAEATRLLARAKVDAELALELARENIVQRRARDARAVVQAAREGK